MLNRTNMIEDLLEQISNNSGILSCGVFDSNGLLVSAKGNKVILEKIASSMHRVIDENSTQFNSLNIAPLECITLIGEEGISLFWPLENSASLALMAQIDANLGDIRRIVKPLLTRINDLIK